MLHLAFRRQHGIALVLDGCAWFLCEQLDDYSYDTIKRRYGSPVDGPPATMDGAVLPFCSRRYVHLLLSSNARFS